MIKFLLLIICILSKLVASVDTQIAAWEDIHSAKRMIPNFSDTQTHFPPVLERIAYMAVYVRTAIAGIKPREARVDEIMGYAESLCKESKLTFQAATGLFWNLAATCDKEEELPESIDKEAERPESMLNKGDLVYLCVPTGGLKISRYVDGYLRPTQLTYIALPNQALKNGPHGISTVRSFFVHDTGHSADSIVDPVIWQTMWPFFERIVTYRTTLKDHSLEKRMIDVLLFHYFHENFLPYVLGRDLEQSIKNKSKIYFNSEILLHGDKSAQKILEERLRVKGIIAATDELFSFHYDTTNANSLSLDIRKVDGAIQTQQVPCEVISCGDVYAKRLSVKLNIYGEEFSYETYGMQNYIDAQYQDILYFLRYADITTLDHGVELPQIVTHTNVEAVINRFNQLIDDAAGLIIKGISFDSQQLVAP